MIVVESSVWIDHLRNRESPARSWLIQAVDDEAPIVITDVIFAELLAGAPTTEARAEIEGMLRNVPILRLNSLHDFERAAACSRATRAAGRRVRGISDCLIASVCIREDAELATADRDFESIAAATPLRLVPLSG